MMVGGVLGDVGSKLCHFDLFLEISFEAAKENFSLSWFEAINDAGDRSAVVGITEVDVLLVDKVNVSQLICVVDHNILLIVPLQPLFPLICLLLIEHQVYCLVVVVVSIYKLQPMPCYLLEILLSFFVCRCSQTFVVFDLPGLDVCNRLTPPFKILHREEWNDLSIFGDFK